MREVINDQELEQVAGGATVIHDDNTVYFSTLGRKFDLKNCTRQQARDLASELLDANGSLNEKEFDALVAKTFRAKGWI